jgi:hypothetical protein
LVAALGTANQALSQYNVFTQPNTAPLGCFDIRVTNLYNYPEGGHNFASHVLPFHAGFTPTIGFSLTNGASGFLRGYIYNPNVFAGGNSLIEIGVDHDQNHPDPNGRIRIELPPNLEFIDASNARDVTADLDQQHGAFRAHVRLVQGVDCNAVAEAAKHPSKSSPAPVPSVKTSTSASTPIACPHLKEIRDGVREINAVASKLENDNSYYQSAVEDMLARGYDSGFARLTFGGPEAAIDRAFSTPAQIQNLKPAVVAAARAAAQFRQQLATAMFAYSQGQAYHAPVDNDAINDAVAGYLCSADPAKMDIASWDVLYKAGYISYPLHKDVKAQMQTNAVVGPIVVAANVIDVAPLAVGILRVAGRAVAVDAGEIGVLKALAKGNLAFETPQTFTTIERRLTGAEVNAELRDLFSNPPFLAEAPAYEASTNETTQLVRFYFKSESGRNNKVGGWLVRRELLIDDEGNLLPAKTIQNRLGLEFPPTHVCDVTVPQNTKFFVGTAGRQPKWGVDGGAEQFYIKDTGPLKYGQDIELTR